MKYVYKTYLRHEWKVKIKIYKRKKHKKEDYRD